MSVSAGGVHWGWGEWGVPPPQCLQRGGQADIGLNTYKMEEIMNFVSNMVERIINTASKAQDMTIISIFERFIVDF